ncbi:hypothetical protein GL263_10490 [Streptomyces durbertensis]|uniref:Uncharacterized protein n=1 Tax=Streptomyces durbertensis TaxID=2448886 RepID=A0ABR6EF82_9ACTN|nr:hypothetical protein [Streptomyces durbertensis]MBB1243981.1 hypothetical protein [Streptomyces durbertensis]
MTCAQCGWPVIEGPEGGYACGQCLHTVEPPGYEERRVAGQARAREVREARTARRRAAARRTGRRSGPRAPRGTRGDDV